MSTHVCVNASICTYPWGTWRQSCKYAGAIFFGWPSLIEASPHLGKQLRLAWKHLTRLKEDPQPDQHNHTLIKHSHVWGIAGMMTPLLIFSTRALSITNDVVFTMWQIIRHDSTLLTWILNSIIQFISLCTDTGLQIVFLEGIVHRLLGCAFHLPEGQRPQLDRSSISTNHTHFYLLESLTFLRLCLSQTGAALSLVWFPVAQKCRNTKLITSAYEVPVRLFVASWRWLSCIMNVVSQLLELN